MTSSLVGSEMCIRDRTKGFDYHSASQGHAVAMSFGHRAMTESNSPRVKSCLLYTSDAADDM
eukprot:1170585-Prorocentrum_lima.AAC.1